MVNVVNVVSALTIKGNFMVNACTTCTMFTTAFSRGGQD
jgi:hypothetical protein